MRAAFDRGVALYAGGATWEALPFWSQTPPSITALAISPAFAHNDTVYAGGEDGAVYRTTNRGRTWSTASTGLTGGSVLALAVASAFQAEDTIFAATVDGIFRSDDGGQYWVNLEAPASAAQALALSPRFDMDYTVFAGTDKTIALAKKYKLKTAWGTDVLFSQRLAQRQGELLAKFTRWYTPAETLAMATGTNGELLAMSGKRNPYPGKLGLVEEGALADLLLVDGDPLTNIKLLEDPAKSLVVIMKDGKIYKNALTQ